jgi:hypothetical protein
MVDAVGLPVADYKLATQNQSRLLAQFQKTPSYAQGVSYYQANIGKVTTVDGLLKDRRLLTVALSAFQLESAIDETGILRKLLTQDPNASGSLAQQLTDPRFKAFAQAFASLNTDGGASLHNPANIDSIIAGYQTNEYEKWISDQDNDPALRQALFFQRQVGDTIDVSSIGNLFATFQQSVDQSATLSYYKSHIANVKGVSDLLADPKLLDVALTAYHLDPSRESTTTINRLLTENPSAAGSLAQTDQRYLAFAQAFSSLKADGGAQISSAANISAVTAAYQTNAFETLLATGDTQTITGLFGTGGGAEIGPALAHFQQRSGFAQATSYYSDHIGKTTTPDDLIDDPQLLNVALGAYQLDPQQVSADTVRTLLTQDPNAAGSLARSDPRYLAFAKAFSSLNSAAGSAVHQTSSVAAVINAYQAAHFESRIGALLQQAQATKASAASATDTNSKTGIGPNGGGITIYQILANPTLAAVTRTALGLPTAVGALDVPAQIQALTRAGFDVGKLQDPAFLDKFVDRFLAQSTLQQDSQSTGGTDAGSAALALLQPNGDGSSDGSASGIDLSFLQNGAGVNLLT